MVRLTLAHRGLVGALRTLAVHLERDVFPMLQNEGRLTLFVQVHERGGLTGSSGSHKFVFPGTEEVALRLRRWDVRELRLDTQLEYGQLVEAVLLLLHAASHLDNAQAEKASYEGWRAKRVAARMLHPEGYHKFCCSLRFDTETRRYDVRYTYCELFFTRLVNTYLENRAKIPDHRALFTAAPRVAVGLTVVFSAAIALAYVAPAAGLVVLAVLGAGMSVAFGAALQAIGSIQYAREHHNKLIQEYYSQITMLSRFSWVNPNPVMKIDREGGILYQNPGVETLLGELGFGEQDGPLILPENYLGVVIDSLDAGAPRETQAVVGGREIHYIFAPFPDEQAVIASGNDVTYLKRIEAELRDLNHHLEEKVRERTEEIFRTQNATIVSLSSLAETRDPETGAHLQRTSAYVVALARQLQTHPGFADALDDETIEHLYRSVPLHDIGKVAIPDAILRKPGKLDASEIAIMRDHPRYGGDALRSAEEQMGGSSFLSVAREVAYYHHERWDGTGYPFGLAGADIPVYARIMTLADVYDALATERVYKKAWPHERIRAYVVKNRGAMFDPALVDAFLELEDVFQEIYHRYADSESVSEESRRVLSRPAVGANPGD